MSTIHFSLVSSAQSHGRLKTMRSRVPSKEFIPDPRHGNFLFLVLHDFNSRSGNIYPRNYYNYYYYFFFSWEEEEKKWRRVWNFERDIVIFYSLFSFSWKKLSEFQSLTESEFGAMISWYGRDINKNKRRREEKILRREKRWASPLETPLTRFISRSTYSEQDCALCKHYGMINND